MASIQDDQGYNQGFRNSRALVVRTRRRSDYIISKMNAPRKETRILEIGCGTGEMAFLIATKTNAKVVAIDKCSSFIDRARLNYARENLDFKVGYFGGNGPGAWIDGAPYDYIVGNGVLHHVYCSIDSTLQQINALLKNGGAMIFLEPNIINPYCALIFRQSFFRKMAKLDPAEMAFSAKFIRQHLVNTGFSEIVIEYKDFLVPIAPGFLISPLILAGNMLEHVPVLNKLSQSIFISSKKPNAR